MSCTFCDIAAGRLAASLVAETAHTVAFLDRSPLFLGHVLVVPREHYETLAELPPTSVEPLFGEVKRLSTAVERAFGAAGSFVALNNRVSQSVPHLHVHVVPRNRKDGLRGFFWPRQKYASDAERDDYATRLRAALS